MPEGINREIVEQIIRDVVKQLYASEIVEEKPDLLFIYPQHLSEDEIERRVKELSATWNVLPMSSHSPQLLPLKDRIQRVIFFEADQDLIMRGSMGLTDTPRAEVLAQALLKGIDITFVLAPSIRWTKETEEYPSHPKKYRDYLRLQKEQLESFGVSFVEIPLLSDLLVSNPVQNEEYYSKRVLTQNEVVSANTTTLFISSSTIVTPLARDTAKERGIKIQVKE